MAVEQWGIGLHFDPGRPRVGGRTMARPLIMVAPNGARRGKKDHLALPVTTPEIVETARACFAAGADALHLHVRDDNGKHSLDASRYKEALSELARAVPKMRVQITTEAAGAYDVPAQLSCLNAVQPDWASISVREIARQADLADRVYGACADQDTEVQHILYDTADIQLLQDWQSRGIVRDGQDSVLFVLGRCSGRQASAPSYLDPFLAAIAHARAWMICAFGRNEHACLARAATQGGDLRIGFENSLLNADGAAYADNAASVASLVKTLERNAA